MNTIIFFGLLASVTVAYGASLPAPKVVPHVQMANAPEQVIELLEPQESSYHGGGHHGGGHHGGGHHGGGHHDHHHGGHHYG